MALELGRHLCLSPSAWPSQVGLHTICGLGKLLCVPLGHTTAPLIFLTTLFPSRLCTQVVLNCPGFSKLVGLFMLLCRCSSGSPGQECLVTPGYVIDIYLTVEEHLNTPTVPGTWKQWTKQTKPLPCRADISNGGSRDRKETKKKVQNMSNSGKCYGEK